MARQNPGHSLPNADKKPHRLFRVVIIDNDTNTYDEVIAICMQALSIGFDEAFQIALAVDNNGKAEVFHGDEASAFRVAEVIRTIGIEVRVEPLDAA